MDERFEAWAAHYRETAESASDLAWPSETLVRLFKGSYVPGLDHDHAGRSVLDVGFGNGNNLRLLASLGLFVHGTEVTQEICDTVTAEMSAAGYPCDLRVGTNRELPFDDDTFDYLTSWNVIHYEDREEQMVEAIREYRRVLKPGGRFFISTTGPEHLILDGAESVGPHLYRIGRDDDFRRGQVFFYFDTPEETHRYFDPVFRDVMVGRTHDFLMTATLDWFIVTGVK